MTTSAASRLTGRSEIFEMTVTTVFVLAMALGSRIYPSFPKGPTNRSVDGELNARDLHRRVQLEAGRVDQRGGRRHRAHARRGDGDVHVALAVGGGGLAERRRVAAGAT